MDKSKSVLQEIATLIHIYKSMASDTILCLLYTSDAADE